MASDSARCDRLFVCFSFAQARRSSLPCARHRRSCRSTSRTAEGKAKLHVIISFLVPFCGGWARVLAADHVVLKVSLGSLSGGGGGGRQTKFQELPNYKGCVGSVKVCAGLKELGNFSL